MANGYSRLSDTGGGNNPNISALVSLVRQNRPGGLAPPVSRQPVGTQSSTPMGPGMEPVSVSDHLVEALRVLAREGPTEQNMAALEQFFLSLQEIARPLMPEAGLSAPQAEAPSGPIGFGTLPGLSAQNAPTPRGRIA